MACFTKKKMSCISSPRPAICFQRDSGPRWISGAKKNSRALWNRTSQRSTAISTLASPASSSQRAQVSPSGSAAMYASSAASASAAAVVAQHVAQDVAVDVEQLAPGSAQRHRQQQLAARLEHVGELGDRALRFRRVGQAQVRDADVERAVGQHQRRMQRRRRLHDRDAAARARRRRDLRLRARRQRRRQLQRGDLARLVQAARQLQRQLAGGAADLQHRRRRPQIQLAQQELREATPVERPDLGVEDLGQALLLLGQAGGGRGGAAHRGGRHPRTGPIGRRLPS